MRIHRENTQRGSQDEWASSATVGSLFQGLATPNSPVGRFRTFITPTLISSYWAIISWLSIGACGAASIWMLFQAVSNAESEKETQRSAIKHAKEEHASIAKTRAEPALNVGQQCLQQGQLNQRELLPFKSDPEVRDVLIFMKSSNKLYNIAGISEYETVDDIAAGVKLVRAGKENLFLVRRDSDLGYVAVLLRGDSALPELQDHTAKYLGMAALSIIVLFVALAVWLVLFRLVCESVLLWFRFVDEVILIRQEMGRKTE